MELIRRLSIRSRILASFGLVLLAFLAFGMNSMHSLSTVHDKLEHLVESSTPAALKSLEISDLVMQATAQLGFYLLSKREEDATAFEERIGRVDGLIAELEAMQVIAGDPISTARLREAKAGFEQLKVLAPQLLELATDEEKNLPAMAFANRETNPTFREKLQQLSALIEAERSVDPEFAEMALPEPGYDGGIPVAALQAFAEQLRNDLDGANQARRELFYHLVTLRYRWLSLNNEIRLFLAFRAPQAVDNVATFKSSVVSTLTELESRKDLFNFEQEEAYASFLEGLDPFWQNLGKLIAIHQADDWRQDAHLVRTRLSSLVQEIGDSLGKMVAREREKMHGARDDVVTLYTNNRIATTLSIVLLVGVIGVIAWFLALGITRPLRRAMAVAERVSQGKLDNIIDGAAQDETGQLMRSLDDMQRDLRERIEAERSVAGENLRIRLALNNVGVPVTVSDAESTLIYMNAAAEGLFEGMQVAWQNTHPHFAAAGLVGQRLSDYLVDADLLATYSAQLSEEVTIEGSVAGRTMRLIASPVYDDEGAYQGRVTQWIDRTDELAARDAQQRRLDHEREIAAENTRIKIALDNVSSNVMMADTDRRIVYLNRSAQALFSDIADDLRAELSGFNPNALLGASIDDFHKDPRHQAGMLDSLKSSHSAEIEVGSRTMGFIANPVVDEQGNRLGTAVEWKDRTAEVAVEREIQRLVEAARAGDLARRVDVHGKHGFFLTLATGFNALLDELSGVFGEIATVMASMADGELQQRVKGDYLGTFGEVQDNINRTLGNLQDMVRKLLDAADDVGTAADEINSGNLNLSNRTEQQASSLQETASSLEELTATVRHNADNARQANQVAAAARSSAQRGGEVVSDAITAMQEINTSSTRIAEIIGVIDEIAFQTNLLALNASVEAARAGEQGRGFAVVATEVRNLASRSAGAAKEIKELIRDSVDKVHAGSDLVNQSGETLQEIVDGVKKVGDIVAEISAASSEQAQGIDQVNIAVSTMDEMTQQNAALAEQTSAASSALRDNAGAMRDLMSFFRTGRPAGAPIARAPMSLGAAKAPTARRVEASIAAVKTSAKPATASVKPPPEKPGNRAAAPPPVSPIDFNEDEWEEF